MKELTYPISRLLIYLLRKITGPLFLYCLMISNVSSQEMTGTDFAYTTTDSVIVSDFKLKYENVGYGIQKKNAVSGSVSGLNSNEFNKGHITNPIQLIQGKVAGLAISKPGSNPNEEFYMRLRGLSTIYANSMPLVVIDGVPDASLMDLDPIDINSITVLKDGSAAAIYGTRASNGVLIITTKNGKNGRNVIEYNISETAEIVAKNRPMMNAEQWRAFSTEVSKQAGRQMGTDFGSSTDWFNLIEQTAYSQVHNFSMSGGTNKSTHRISINYRNVEGILKNTGYKQLNGRINLTQKALNDKLILIINMGATNRFSEPGFSQVFRYAAISNPTAPVKSNDPEYSRYDGYFQQQLFDMYNPVQIVEQDKNESKNSNLNLSIRGTYEILKDLKIDVFYALQNYSERRREYYDKNDYWRGFYQNGNALQQNNISLNRLFESIANYNQEISSSVNVSFLGGYSFQDFSNEGFFVQGGDLLTDNFTFNNLGAALDFKNGNGTSESYKNSNRLIAFFGRFNLDINQIWFLNTSARYEGSSRFGANNKWGLFPSIGTAVDITKFVGVDFISYLKLRANYGVTGNQPSESYLSLPRLGVQGVAFYNNSFIPGYMPVNNENPDLKWEKKSEFDFGFDFTLYNSKLSGAFDFYLQTTTDLLYPNNSLPVPPNLYPQVWMNLGKLKSSGMELTLNCRIIQKNDFSYNLFFTGSRNFENTLVSLSGSYNGTPFNNKIQLLGNIGSPGHSGIWLVKVEEGKPIGQLQAVVLDEIDAYGNTIFVDQNEDGYIGTNDMITVGNGLPKYLIGVGNDFAYKNWDMTLFFRGVFGHSLVNSFRSFYEAPYTISSYNLLQTAVNLKNKTTGTLMQNYSGMLSNEIVENGSFLCLDNISLGYNFNLSESSKFSKMKLYIAGNNLFYLTKYKGSDPEPRYIDNVESWGINNSTLVPGIDRRDTWSRSRSVTFGANIVF